MSNLILGYGLLGKQIHKLTGWDFMYGSMKDLTIPDKYDTVINCIGYTSTYDNDRDKHWEANLQIVKRVIDLCNKRGIKYIHISTDYIYAGSKSFASEKDIPVHNNCWYTYTKLVADALVQLESNDYLICRGTHKPFPFPYNKAWTNQVGNFDFVHVIAKLIIQLIEKKASGIFNVGTGLKTMYELAGSDKEKILKDDHIPGDVTMDISKLKKFLK